MIDGTDKGGVTEMLGWNGGGGFRYFSLPPSLVVHDSYGRETINTVYTEPMLAEAVCKHEGYVFDPSETVFWQHGHANERDFIYVVPQTLTQGALDALSEAVGDDQHLVVVCRAWRGTTSGYTNLTVKRIPRSLRDKCEWGHDDYSFSVDAVMPPRRRRPRAMEADLFDGALDAAE